MVGDVHTLCVSLPVFALATLEGNVLPEIGWQLALCGGVPSCGRAVGLHASRVLTVTDVGVGVAGHYHAAKIE